MNNIETNAIGIAELLGYKINPYDSRLYMKDSICYGNIELINKYSQYAGLMPIIESEISEYELKAVHFELEGCGLLETVQKHVIKYLELKNGK